MAPDGIYYEADQRHAEIIVKEMGVSKSVSSPSVKEEIRKAGVPKVKEEMAIAITTTKGSSETWGEKEDEEECEHGGRLNKRNGRAARGQNDENISMKVERYDMQLSHEGAQAMRGMRQQKETSMPSSKMASAASHCRPMKRRALGLLWLGPTSLRRTGPTCNSSLRRRPGAWQNQ